LVKDFVETDLEKSLVMDIPSSVPAEIERSGSALSVSSVRLINMKISSKLMIKDSFAPAD
jgi:hypothetical protein